MEVELLGVWQGKFGPAPFYMLSTKGKGIEETVIQKEKGRGWGNGERKKGKSLQ